MKNKLNEKYNYFEKIIDSVTKSTIFCNSESLKGGANKMISDIQNKISEYFQLITAIKEQFDDPAEVLAVLKEICQDMRAIEHQQQKSFNSDLPATENQIAYLKTYGAIVTKNIDLNSLTKQQASCLIDQSMKIRAELQKAFNKPLNTQKSGF
jgi:hypothetical protein